METPTHKPKSLRARILSGSVILLSGSGLATAVNFAYNVAVARFLGPQGFGDATVVYTLLTLLSAVTLSFQIISAKVVAQQKTPETKSAGYRVFHHGAWACGVLVGVSLLVFQGAIARYLNLPSPLLVALLAVGVAFYVPLGSRRGYIQGAYGFRRLAANLVLEGVVRLGGSLFMIWLGFGVPGVIAANSAAIAVAYFAIVPQLTSKLPSPLRLSHAAREMSQALVFFSGQVLINNCDIVLVKHFFLPEAAGLYAAVAMVGRVIFGLSQAVVNSMFPLVAGTDEEDRRDLTVIATSLLLVLSIGAALALALRFAPAQIWTAFFGAKFAIAGKYGLPYLLGLYAITTVVYSLSAVIITYEMSYKIANSSWTQLVFSGVVIIGICLFHSSLRQVILVQFVLLIVLLIFVSLPFLISSLTETDKTRYSGAFRPVKLVRRVSEDEVIGQFLKSDFHNVIFRDYQEGLRVMVNHPNFHNPAENATRRALFYMRHRALWTELPADTEWYEMEITENNLNQIRVFPRAQWRKIGQGNFAITEIAACMRSREHAIDTRFVTKISEISHDLAQNEAGLGHVILIGTSENDPLTVLDGNHRLLASMLSSPSRVHRLRFLCGLSPHMTECCWHTTNLATLLRYGRNILKHSVRRHPRVELVRSLESA